MKMKNCIAMEKTWHMLTLLLSLLFMVGTVYGLLGSKSYPGTETFAILLLASCSYAGGFLTNCIGLPPLLGMLIVGILFRNSTFIPYHEDISLKSASTFRDVALVVILLKAGMGLDPVKLMEMKMDAFKLSTFPCLAETAGTAGLAYFIFGMPLLWAFMLGFIMSAASAAVLVPGMLDLQERRLGTDAGVPTLIMAAVSVDNILALTGFVITFSLITTTSKDLAWTIVKRPVEPFLGLILGGFFGTLLWYFPSEDVPKRDLVFYRSLLLGLSGLSFQLVSRQLDFAGVGALGCVSVAFVASLHWRKDEETFKNIQWITGLWWIIIEPFLFGLIGVDVKFETLQKHLGLGTLVLVLALVIRALATVLALAESKVNWKGAIFVSMSWLSKATVQAAVGSQALDYVKQNEESPKEYKEYGELVLSMSVLCILVTAPLGATFINYMGSYLLKPSRARSLESSLGSSTTDTTEDEHIAEVTVAHYGSTKSPVMKGILKDIKTSE